MCQFSWQVKLTTQLLSGRVKKVKSESIDMSMSFRDFCCEGEQKIWGIAESRSGVKKAF